MSVHFPTFTNALASHASFAEHPAFGGKSCFKTNIYRVIFGKKHELQSVTTLFLKYMDALEKVKFNLNEVSEEQKNCQKKYTTSLETLIEELKANKMDQMAFCLRRRMLALTYRAKITEFGNSQDGVIGQYLFKWKKEQNFYADYQKNLTPRDNEVLTTLSSYPEFLSLLKEDSKLRDSFFKWAIRDNNCPQVFIEFPSVTEWIQKSLLSGRFGRFREQKILNISSNTFKDITVRFQVEDDEKKLVSKEISLLDPFQSLTFRGGVVKTVEEVFKQFQNKNADVGNFEVFGGDEKLKPEDMGILHWHPHEMGYFSERTARYMHPATIEEMPVFEIIDKEKLKKITGLENLTGKEWGVAMVKATRITKQLDVEGCHGFLEVAIKQQDGRYRIFHFGKFAKIFPTSLMHYLKFLANTVIARVEYPDSNNYYSMRQKATVPYVLNEEMGNCLMGLIKKELEKSHNDNLVFMFGWENCAYWPHSLLSNEGVLGDKIDNIFRIPILATQMTNSILSFLVKSIKRLPKNLQKWGVNVVMWFLGYKRFVEVIENGKKMIKSLYLSPCFQDSNVYQTLFCPSNAHKLIEEKKLKGVLHGGHGD